MTNGSVASIAPDAPASAPDALSDVRTQLATELLAGSGIEIGALHLPLSVPAGVSVRYVDRMSVEELRRHYPELAAIQLTPVDVIDDGEQLHSFGPESLDFIVANHFLEHCEDPIGTIGTHLEKLRSGGVLFYAVPDKRYTFDFRRPRTPLSHVVADHEDGGRASRSEHYLEWASLVYPEGGQAPDEQAAVQYAAELEKTGYSIHFHVWAQADLLEMMAYCAERLGSFDIEAVRRMQLENIVVLRKHGALAAKEARGTAALPESIPETGVSPAMARIPLSALRVKLDDGSANVDWLVSPDGLVGRALLQPAGSLVTIPLRLGGAARFTARVRLLPHDWRDGVSAVRAWVASSEADGSERTLWSGCLPAARAQGNPKGLLVACELPRSTAALKLGLERAGSGTGPLVGRAAWMEPCIFDHSNALAPSAKPPTPSPLRRETRSGGPFISVLMPVHDPPLHMLEEAIASVHRQTFADWELCLVDDGSANPDVIAALERHAASDPRIHLRRRPSAGGIAVATNLALELATSEYVALLDHDDTLAANALEHVAERIGADPNLDMIYSDEDIVMDGRRIWLHLKPGWSLDTLRTNGYTCHLGVYRRDLVRDIGGFRSEFNGSQDVDMILRLVERTDRIDHIPRVLYHWRAHVSSTAGGDAKPYAYVAARNAIQAHLERTGVDARVDFGPPGLYRVVHEVDPSRSVALVLAVQDERGLADAAESWLAQPHPTWTVVVAAPEHSITACADALDAAGVERSRVSMVATVPGGDAAASGLAAAATTAEAEHLLLMQSPAAGLTHDWLTRLIGYSDQDGVAAAGPIVLAPDGRIQHGGIAVPEGIPLHLLHGSRSSMDNFFGYGTSVFNVSAVSGMLATRRDIYQRLGGLDPQLGEFALIDYCLRATDTCQRIVIVPDARLRTTGADTTTNDLPMIWRLRNTWAQDHTHDPYYNSNYRTDRGDFEPIRA